MIRVLIQFENLSISIIQTVLIIVLSFQVVDDLITCLLFLMLLLIGGVWQNGLFSNCSLF